MIYLLHGSDKDKSRLKAHSLINSLLKKKTDATLFNLNSQNWNQNAFEEYVGGQGLFVQKSIVFADSLLEDKDTKEFLIEKVKDIAASGNIFIFLEGELDKKTLGKFEKSAEKVEEHSLKADTKKRQEFNVFSLTDALGRRDKKNLWVLYQKAKKAGIEDEQIHGTLFWQIKSMILASESKSAGDAGLNPFVYSKASGFSKNFSKEELRQFSSELVSLYHNSRRGIHDMDVAMERFVLKI
jgi:hypothetical protein